MVECTENKTQNISLTTGSQSSSVNCVIAVRSKFHLTYVISELLLNCFKKNQQTRRSCWQSAKKLFFVLWKFVITCVSLNIQCICTQSHLCYAGYSVTDVSGERFLSHGTCILFCLVKLRQ